MKQVILTGLRANDDLTLGNYLGAILPMVEMQQKYAGDYQINMFVPDLHSFTTPIDHTTLYDNSIRNLKYYLAAGLDINNPDVFLYRQSFIPAHSELTWILDCFAYMGEISRMIQYKEKSEDLKGNVSVGLFNYPILMAADILLYNAKYIPLGEDQFQHVEICRDIANRMNNKFGDIFVVPAPTQAQTKFVNRDNGLRIRSLTEPTKKMSKSSTDQKSKIMLLDSPESAAQKIMSATTDSIGVINYDWNEQPGLANLIQILAVITHQEVQEVAREWQGQTEYGKFKQVVAKSVADFLTDFQSKYQAVSDQDLMAKLEQSEHDMSILANETLLRVQKAVGLRK